MVSFDIGNIFINVLIISYLPILQFKLKINVSLENSMKHLFHTITELIGICISNNYFQVGNM